MPTAYNLGEYRRRFFPEAEKITPEFLDPQNKQALELRRCVLYYIALCCSNALSSQLAVLAIDEIRKYFAEGGVVAVSIAIPNHSCHTIPYHIFMMENCQLNFDEICCTVLAYFSTLRLTIEF